MRLFRSKKSITEEEHGAENQEQPEQTSSFDISASIECLDEFHKKKKSIKFEYIREDGEKKEIYLKNWSFIDEKKRIRGIEVNKNKVGSSERPIPTNQSEFNVDSIIRVTQPNCTQNMISVLKPGNHFGGGRRRTKNKKNKRKTIKHKAKRQTRKQRKQPSRRRR